jgi:hypothetical protein
MGLATRDSLLAPSARPPMHLVVQAHAGRPRQVNIEVEFGQPRTRVNMGVVKLTPRWRRRAAQPRFDAFKSDHSTVAAANSEPKYSVPKMRTLAMWSPGREPLIASVWLLSALVSL